MPAYSDPSDIVTFKQANAPAGPTDGDLWVDTSVSPPILKSYESSSDTWFSVTTKEVNSSDLPTRTISVGYPHDCEVNTRYAKTVLGEYEVNGAFTLDGDVTLTVKAWDGTTLSQSSSYLNERPENETLTVSFDEFKRIYEVNISISRTKNNNIQIDSKSLEFTETSMRQHSHTR